MVQQTIFEVQAQRGGTMVTLRLVLPAQFTRMPLWLVERLETGDDGPQWVPDSDQWLTSILLVALHHRLGSDTGGVVRLGQFKYDAAHAIPGIRDGFVFEPAPPKPDVEQVFTSFTSLFGDFFGPKNQKAP